MPSVQAHRQVRRPVLHVRPAHVGTTAPRRGPRLRGDRRAVDQTLRRARRREGRHPQERQGRRHHVRLPGVRHEDHAGAGVQQEVRLRRRPHPLERPQGPHRLHPARHGADQPTPTRAPGESQARRRRPQGAGVGGRRADRRPSRRRRGRTDPRAADRPADRQRPPQRHRRDRRGERRRGRWPRTARRSPDRPALRWATRGGRAGGGRHRDGTRRKPDPDDRIARQRARRRTRHAVPRPLPGRTRPRRGRRSGPGRPVPTGSRC